jgi:hypothetical protein
MLGLHAAPYFFLEKQGERSFYDFSNRCLKPCSKKSLPGFYSLEKIMLGLHGVSIIETQHRSFYEKQAERKFYVT